MPLKAEATRKKNKAIYESQKGFDISDLFRESDIPTNQFKAENAIREPGASGQ